MLILRTRNFRRGNPTYWSHCIDIFKHHDTFTGYTGKCTQKLGVRIYVVQIHEIDIPSQRRPVRTGYEISHFEIYFFTKLGNVPVLPYTYAMANTRLVLPVPGHP